MNPDFVDLLRAFVAADVRFLVVGAYALALHGRPRATGDLDLWVEPTPANAARVMRALAAFAPPSPRSPRRISRVPASRTRSACHGDMNIDVNGPPR
jgi:hypothetical protein